MPPAASGTSIRKNRYPGRHPDAALVPSIAARHVSPAGHALRPLEYRLLWVMDETQLMGPGLWTSAQLDWLRNDRFKSLYPCATWWLSATIGKNFLETRDRVNALAEEKLPPLAPIIEIQTNEARDLDILQAKRPVELWIPPAVRGKKKGTNR